MSNAAFLRRAALCGALGLGYEARVTGERPFRVRIGRYAKRADATALVAKLKAEKTA